MLTVCPDNDHSLRLPDVVRIAVKTAALRFSQFIHTFCQRQQITSLNHTNCQVVTPLPLGR